MFWWRAALLGVCSLVILPVRVPATTQAPATAQVDATDAIDVAMRAMYNLDFSGAERVLDAHIATAPSDPAGHAARATARLFAEFNRLQILELEFFGRDDDVTGKLRLKPDPAARAGVLAAAADARRLADATLRHSPNDRRALFAMTMAVSAEVQYAGIVEKRYTRSSSLSKQSQKLADRMLALDPPIYDAYVTLGAIEYVVANLNPFYRFVARLYGLRGSKERAIEHLQIVMTKGRYYRPFAKMLAAVLYLREGQLKQARSLMDELQQEFPANPLYAREVRRIDAKIASGG